MVEVAVADLFQEVTQSPSWGLYPEMEPDERFLAEFEVHEGLMQTIVAFARLVRDQSILRLRCQIYFHEPPSTFQRAEVYSSAVLEDGLSCLAEICIRKLCEAGMDEADAEAVRIALPWKRRQFALADFL